MYDNKNNKNNSQLNQIDVTQDVTQSKKKETFIVLYERYLLDGNLDLLDKLFYAFFVSLHNQGCVINISNEGLAKKIKIKPDENISIRTTQRSLQKLEDLNYIKRYINKKTGERIIVPVFKFEAEHPEQNIEQTFHDRHGNVYKKIDHVTNGAGGDVTDGAHDKVDASSYQICHTYNKDNNKENNNFVITKDSQENEFKNTIKKAKEILETTKTNLPSTVGEVKQNKYQETRFLEPVKNNTKLKDYVASYNPFNLPQETIDGFIEMRKAKQNPLTPHAWKLLQSSLKKCVDGGYTAQECIEMATLHGWSGIQKEWMDRVKGKFANPNHLDHNSIAWAEGFNSPLYNLDGVSKNE